MVDQGLVQQVQAFSGAWPYLELISAGCDIRDPLDQRVVEAYWVGNELLDRVLVGKLGDSMAERFRKQLGNKFQFLAEGVLAAGCRTTASTCSACTRGWACSATTRWPGTRSRCWTGAGSGGAR